MACTALRAGAVFLALGGLALAGPAGAQTVDGTWMVSAFTGDAIFLEPDTVIGQVQAIEGGFAEGPLYGCDFAGQSMRYTMFEMPEFMAARGFEMFAPVREEIARAGAQVFVHRINCNGGDDPQARRALYPLVTVDDAPLAWYPFEEGVFTLELQR